MQKRRDAQIYIISHKPIDYQREDSLYSPLQVGFNDKIAELRDNTGDNISEWNPLYAECTGTYWIWKNHPDLKYVGQTQYRRRLEFPEDENFDDIFSRYDVITMTPLFFAGTSVQFFYGYCHNPEDMSTAEDIVKTLYPDMTDSWNKYLKTESRILYSNGFIMRAEDYDRYCSFLFSVFEEFKKRKGWDTLENAKEALDAVRHSVEEDIVRGRRQGTRGIGYQMQVFGFLSERLWTLWCFHTFPQERIMFKDYRKFEGV